VTYLARGARLQVTSAPAEQIGVLALAAGLTLLVVVIESARAGTGDLNIPALSSAEGLRAILTNTGFAMLVAAVLRSPPASSATRPPPTPTSTSRTAPGSWPPGWSPRRASAC
jgi:hypothetical protein